MIKVALTNLGQYTEGRLNYTWLTLPATTEEIQEAMLEVGIDGVNYEEYFITDWESEVSGLEISEYSNLDNLNELAERLTEVDTDLVGALIRTQGYDLEEAIDKADDTSYIQLDKQTMLDDESNLAYSFIDEVYGNVSELGREQLERYFDYEGFGRDLRIEGLQDEEGFEHTEHFSDEELGIEYVEMLGSLECLGDNTLETYFDYEMFGRDLSFDYSIDTETMLAVSNY